MELMQPVPMSRILRWVRKLTYIGLICAAAMAAVIGLTLLYLRSQPLPPSVIEQTTTIYGADGQVLDTLFGGENRTVIPLNKIPRTMLEATVAIEDKNFYSHLGFDFKRLAKAIVVDITHMAKVQGASTITQQLARNLYLTLDKTWDRKIREAFLTIQLELNYSKDELIALYLNQIYYGHSAYGIQAAAKTYFGKNASDLDLAESAMLAGIPKGPAFFSPYLNMDQAKSRQKSVLNAMAEHRFITKAQAEQAYQEKLKLAGLVPSSEKVIAPYFRDYVTSLMKGKYHFTDEQLMHGGLKIYTTLDPVMQEKAEKIVAKYMPKDRPLQAALVAMDPRTGAVRAMVGGTDYKKSQYNRVFAKRQPGSSFKAFLYLAALKNGYTPVTELKSEPTVFTYGKDQTYIPKNFGDSYPYRDITLQEAIARSDNIYAVKTNMQLGPAKLVEEAKKLGIVSPLSAIPSLALGTKAVSPMEMVDAYATIANQGERVDPVFITKIVDNEGKVLVEEKPNKTRVEDPVPSFLLTHLLEGVFKEGGTAYRVAHLLKRPVAGKTGTTDYDSWLVGFTPQLALAVWTGYDEGKKIDEVTDARLAAPIWAEFMESALAGQPPQLFSIPDGVHTVYIDPQSQKLATEFCPTQKLVYFADGTEPKDYCAVHVPKGVKIDPQTGKKEKSLWDKFLDLW